MKTKRNIIRLGLINKCMDAKALATEANVSEKTVYKAIQGESLRAPTLGRILKVLDIAPEDAIVQEDDNE